MSSAFYQGPGWAELRVDDKVWAHLKVYLSQARTHSSHIPEPPYYLSRYTSLVASKDENSVSWQLISPLAVGTLVIEDARVLMLLHALPTIPPDFDTNAAMMLIKLLGQAGFLDDRDQEYALWPAQELMHVANPPIDPRAQRLPIAPLKPPMSDDVVVLPEIAPERWKDASFVNVIQARRSKYVYGEKPITLDQLSEFLTRTLRSHGEVKGDSYDTTLRWYPSAGAAYELEAYLAIYHCAGLAAGFYHYHPGNHTLERLPLDASVHQNWGEGVSLWTGYQLKQPPQILFSFTARIGRIHNKKRALALAYTNLGVVEQTLYLTATAMNLAPCALGGGPAKRFVEEAGIPLAEEALVGNFLLGSSQDVKKD